MGVSVRTRQAYSEIDEFLGLLSDEQRNKIPQKLREFFREEKDENYIKNVVGFYRQKLDKVSEKSSSGKIFFDFEPNVSKSFNRGFTDYFLDKRGKIYNFDTPKSIGEKVGKIEKVGKNYFVINLLLGK